LRGILFKMHPKLAPRGRGLCPRPLGAGFGCILNRTPLKNPPKTGPGSHIYSPEALLTNLEYFVFVSARVRVSLLNGPNARACRLDVSGSSLYNAKRSNRAFGQRQPGVSDLISSILWVWAATTATKIAIQNEGLSKPRPVLHKTATKL